jgi:hypothetical protein
MVMEAVLAYLYYSLVTICLYFYLGIGLTTLFCPNELRKYTLVLSPIVGYCYLTLIGWYFYKLDTGGTDVYAKFILVIPTLTLVFLLTKYKKIVLIEWQSLLFDREFILTILISVLGFIIVSLPLIVSNDALTSITLVNNDPANYALVSRYLKEFSRFEEIGLFAEPAIRIKWLIEDTVFGALISTSFIASLFSLDVYQVQSLNINVFFIFGIPTFYVIARNLFQYNYLGASAVTLLYALNPVIYYTIYQGFLSQIIATTVSLGIFLLNIQAASSCKKFSNWYKYLPLCVLFNWGISITYPHMLPLLYAPIITYIGWQSFYTKSWKLFSRYSLFVFLSLLITSILSVDRLISLVNYVFFTGNAEAGWYMPFILPAQIFSGFIRNSQIIDILFSIPISVFLIFGFAQAYKSNKRLLILAISSVAIIMLGYIILGIKNLEASGQLGGYKSYKLLSFFLPQVMLSCLIFFQRIHITRKIKIQAIALALIIIFESCHTFGITAQVMKDKGTVTPEMVKLKTLEAEPSIKSINILGQQDMWQIMWTAYFLARKKLYFQTQTYYPASKLEGDWNLWIVDPKNPVAVEQTNSILKFVGFDSGSLTSINSRYKIQKAPSLQASLETGWYESEGTHIWSGNASNSSSLVINSKKDKDLVDVYTNYFPLNPKNKISIHFNGKKVLDCDNNEYCNVPKLQLLKGLNKLDFVATIKPEKPGNGDPRTLSYAFSSIKIVPSSLSKTK